ncbi:hypothetical protein EJ05DRAFT_477516 [Pseudovirgaria hyperparasitica]|uniref:LysM domain-containing protein n=1 Tax=Pseudovirgaria hyperparasitica TaxID=470096 RepID=A0A6A6W2X7_9PEZI|nr:uncharacterized protein EJ05DRAFT_477516 [Pseudovirgaria hyperparasitica]KAF2756346.1 hypothetical protein EJ05DRAFT_477516 [Pseudovirgaria hyperparasitica]
MSRFSRRDSDDERLPAGMRRVGYDSDTQKYQYVDEDGKYYEGSEGARYGQLRPVGGADSDRLWSREDRENSIREGLLSSGDEEEGFGRKGGRRKMGIDDRGETYFRAQNLLAYRYILPFVLVCFVFLLVVFRFLDSGTSSSAPSQSLNCPEGAVKYVIKDEDICVNIARNHGCTVDVLISLNRESGLECNHLEVGTSMCVPGAGTVEDTE